MLDDAIGRVNIAKSATTRGPNGLAIPVGAKYPESAGIRRCNRVEQREAVVQRPLHPVNTILLAGTVPLFLGVLLTDIAYYCTYEIQWKNFASWLLVGGLLFGGLALLAAIIEFFRASSRGSREAVYVLLLVATWILGLVDAFVHAGDAWASMPRGLVLSAIVIALAITATALRLSASGRVTVP